MSVTFTIESRPTGFFRFNCGSGFRVTRILLEAASYTEAVRELAGHKTSCETCDADGAFVTAVGDVDDVCAELDVKLSNAHAAALLRTVGLHGEDLAGTVAAPSLLARVVVAVAERQAGSHVLNTVTTTCGECEAAISDINGSELSDQHRRSCSLHLEASAERTESPAIYEMDVLARLFRLASAAACLRRNIEWA